MEAKFAAIVLEGRVEFVRPMDPAPIDHHHDFLLSFPEGCHHLVHILAQLLRIQVREDFREDFGGPILHRANDTEQLCFARKVGSCSEFVKPGSPV